MKADVLPARLATTLSALVSYAFTALLAVNGAAAQGTAAGDYTTSPQRLEAQVTTWGEDCGPKPQSQTVPEQALVKVSEEAGQLVLRFPDRTVRTNACWSPNVAMKLTSTTASNGKYRVECRTAQGDAKKETGRYTLTASAGKLELLEESEYDWQLKQSHCVAKVRMVQTLTSGAKPAPAADASVALPAVEPAPAPSCVLGTPVRLRLRPTDGRIGPGERICFSARGTDAAGCAKDLPAGSLSFSLSKPNGAQGSLSGACFKAASNAALAEGVFRVTVHAGSLRDAASVTVSALDLSDITARRGPSGNSGLNQNAPGNETVFESGVRAVASGSHGLLWLSLSLVGIAAVLSAIALGALRLTRRRAAEAKLQSMRPAPSSFRPSAPTASAPVAPKVAAAPVRLDGPQRICPRCRRGYAPFTARCAIDDEPLLDYGDFLRKADESAAPRNCPNCGEQLAKDSLFCGRCGHKVSA